MKKILLAWVAVGCLSAPGVDAAGAATAASLKAMLERGEAVTVIDIRSAREYGEGHIPGAINIPAVLVPGRTLPPLGKVVVCGVDVAAAETAGAVRALNGKPGIAAEALEGGYGAWFSLGYANTRPGGIEGAKDNYVTYQELERAAANPDLVLLDLRRALQGAAPRETAGPLATGNAPRGLTDLAAQFPGVKIVKFAPATGANRTGERAPATALPGGATARAGRFYVLIDDGDGTAEQVAHRLKAAGVGRVAILTGGETTLVLRGKAGLGTTGTVKK